MVKATAGGGGTEIPLPIAGTYLTRCYSMIDIGTIPTTFEGKDTGKKHKIYLTWELPDQLAQFSENSPPEPFVIGLEFTLSTADRANLSKIMKAWRGHGFSAEEKAGFDPATCVGKTGMAGIQHKARKDATLPIQIATNKNSFLGLNTLTPIMAGMAEPPQKNPYFIFDWDKPFDMETFVRVPNWLQEKMLLSDEFKVVAQQKGWTQESFKAERISTICRLYTAGEVLPGYARRIAEENNAPKPMGQANAENAQQNVAPVQQTIQQPVQQSPTAQAPVQEREDPETNVGGGWLQ